MKQGVICAKVRGNLTAAV